MSAVAERGRKWMKRRSRELDPTSDSDAIVQLLMAQYVPRSRFGLNLGYTVDFIRLAGPVRGAPPVDRDGRGLVHAQPDRRADDTAAYLAGWLHDGADAATTKAGLAHVRRMHDAIARRWPMDNDVFLHGTSLFATSLSRTLRLVGAPDIEPSEKAALTVFWRKIATALGVHDIPADFDGFERYLREYEASPRFAHSVAGERLARALLEQFVRRYFPRPLRAPGRWFVLSLVEPHVLETLHLSPPPAPVVAAVRRAVRAQILVQTRLAPDPRVPPDLRGLFARHDRREAPEPPAPLPLPPGVRHRFVEVGDVRIHVAEAGSGPPLLLLHGEPQHWYLWRHVFERLADRYHVIAPDLRGMGWSDAPRGSYRKEVLASDVLGLVEALDLRDVRLVGHDYGGIVGFILCLRQPERFVRYLALATYHPWIGPLGVAGNLTREWYQLITGAPWLGPLVIRRFPAFWLALMRWGVRNPETWLPGEAEHYARHVGAPERAEATSRLVRSLLPELVELRRRYGDQRLVVPTRMLLGSRDFAISRHLLRGWQHHADDMTVEILPGASHWIPNELPDLVQHEIESFLR